jgi:hypothetical protein
MSNRNKISAASLLVFARNFASTRRSGHAFPLSHGAATLYQKRYCRRQRILYSICPKCPPPNHAPHLATNTSLIFVSSWVSKCKAVRSRAFVRQTIVDFAVRFVSLFGCGHWGGVQ